MLKKSEIRSYFNKGHQELMSRATRRDAIGFNYQEKRRWFISHLRNICGRMLDIGCNVGNLAFLLRENGVPAERLHFTCIDIAEEAIAVAKKRNIAGTTFKVGSALELPFPDQSFDAVTLVEVIEHIPDQSGVICEAARVLKPDGLLLLSTPNAECQPWLFDERLRFFAWRLLGKKLMEKDVPLTLPALKRILLDSNLSMPEEPRYYWYRPYHIFKGCLWWPVDLAVKGLFGAMNHCRKIEESSRLTQEYKRKYCQSILAIARKKRE